MHCEFPERLLTHKIFPDLFATKSFLSRQTLQNQCSQEHTQRFLCQPISVPLRTEMNGLWRVTWAPPEGALAADQDPSLHCRSCCQLVVCTPQTWCAPPALIAPAASFHHSSLRAQQHSKNPLRSLFTAHVYMLQKCCLPRLLPGDNPNDFQNSFHRSSSSTIG